MPDCIIARSDRPLDDDILGKIAMFCNVERRAVIANENVNPIYALPLLLHERGFDDYAVSRLSLECGDCRLDAWRAAVGRMTRVKERRVRIAICGKYVKLHDAYLSINEALYHAASWNDADLELLFIDTELHGLDFVFVFTNHLLIDSKCIEKHYRHSDMVFCRPSKCYSAKLKSTGEQIKMLNMTIRVHDNFLIAPHPRLLHYSSSSRLRIFW